MPTCEHLVQFYESDAELFDSVVPYLAEGLGADEAVLVLATETHLRAIADALSELDVGFELAVDEGRYVALDSAEALERIRPGAAISARDFELLIGSLVRERTASGDGLRAYGELVALLWDEGDTAAAIELEGLWNELCDQEEFSLFCGYRAPPVRIGQEALRQVCRRHTHVIPSVTCPDALPVTAPITVEFAPSIEAPGRVRALLRATLRELDFGEDLIERGTLAASELAANAVVHAGTSFRLLVEPKEDSVLIAVEDGAPLGDRRRVVGRSPHGLGLIAALALRWGITPRKRGKLVWAEIGR